MAFAVYGMAVVLAPAIGPTLGGWITDNFQWRWIFFINIPVGIVSLLLTQRLIQDPPYLKQQKRGRRVDYIGLGLLAVGLGFLQVVLDKGERDDWFSSHFILITTIVSVGALIALVIWEWRNDDPIIDLHLFRDRSFAVGNFLMFMVGFALMSSTVLLPLFMQTILGYTAEQAGLALMPGGFAIIVAMPIIGFLLSRYDARWLLVFGLSLLSFALFYMTHFDPQIDFKTAALARVLQGLGLSCLFVPINTAAYAFLPKEKNNAASGLINLGRNVGGSLGISLVATMLSRRTQVHQQNLTGRLNAGNGGFQATIRQLEHNFVAHGASLAQATHQAYAVMGNMINQQATMLAYVDDFWMVGWAVLVMIPLVFLMKKVKPGGPMAVH
jgi:DHA2 family multidrug resistance protein